MRPPPIPREWVDAVVGANPELDLLSDARRLGAVDPRG